MRIQASLVALLVACGDDDPTPPADAPPVLRLPVNFRVRGEVPRLLAIRDVPGEWTVLPTNATGMYTADAALRHQIAMVCGAPGAFSTTIEMRVRTDSDPFLFCFNGDNPAPTFPITGQMLQPGQVSMSGMDDSTTAPWLFDLAADAGAHDLVAFGSSLVLVRPNLMITAATTIPTIDLAQGGEAYATTTSIISNRETDEVTQTELTVFVENDVASLTRSGATLYELPASQLGAGIQFGTVAALTPTTRRDTSIAGTSVVNVTLLPRLSGITFGEIGPSWTMLPLETDSVSYLMFTPTNDLSLRASGQYLAGDTSLAIELDIPGFDAAWRVPAADRVHRFSIYDEDFSESSMSSAPMPVAFRSSLDERRQQVLRERVARHR